MTHFSEELKKVISDTVNKGLMDGKDTNAIIEDQIIVITELVKGMVPEENLPPLGSLEDKYGYLAGQRKGFNSCRTEMLRRLK